MGLLLATTGAVGILGQGMDLAPELETYVVTASGFEQLIQHAPASISLLSREEILEFRADSIAEMLRSVEGVDVGNTAGKTGGMTISIRGMPSDYTLVLVDGRRQNVAGNVTPNGFGETSTSFLPPAGAIERVEVIRGPMSTLYGSDAIGGVVNIITRKDAQTWRGNVSVAATLQENQDFGDSGSGNFFLAGPLGGERLGIMLKGSVYHREASGLSFWDEEGNPVEVSRRGPSPVKADIRTVGGRLMYRPSSTQELWVDIDHAWQGYDNSEGQLGTLGVQGYAEKLEFVRNQQSVAHSWRMGDAVLDTGLMRNTTETTGRVMPSGTPGKTPGSPRDLENTNGVVDSKLVVRLGTHTLTVGGQYWDAEMIDGVAVSPYWFDQWALFAENEWRVLSDVGLTLGVRRDQHSDFGEHVSPRAYVVWNLDTRWTLKGGVGQGFKAPRLDQIADGITGFTAQGTRPTIGTPGLRPEKSTSSEVLLAYHNQAGLSGSLTLFHNAFNDKIANGPGVPNATYAANPNRPGSVDYGNWPLVDLFAQLVNVDRAVTQGVEVLGQWEFQPSWTLSGTYTYTESEQKTGANKGAPLTNTPKHMLNARLRWNISPVLSLWLNGEYRSERYRSPDTGMSTAKLTHGDYRAYALYSLGCSYRASERLTVNANVSNLLNKDFVAYVPYVSDTATGDILYTNLYNNNQEPRRLWVSATWAF